MNKFVRIMTIGVRPRRVQRFYRSHPKVWFVVWLCNVALVAVTVKNVDNI